MRQALEVTRLRLGKLPWSIAAATWLTLFGAIAATTVFALPMHDVFMQRMLPWILARATGLAAFSLMTLVVLAGIFTSHPQNLSEWRLSRILIIWHRYLTVLLMGLIVVHVGAIILDAYAKVGLLGALVPGLSGYRPLAVALGTVALYGLGVLTLTAGYPKLVGGTRWLSIHRAAVATYALVWLHGMLAGSDTLQMQTLYVLSGILVLLAFATRWWIASTKSTRPAGAGSKP